MNELLATTWGLSLRHARTMVRIKTFLVLDLVQPMIWLLLYGQLFERAVQIPGFKAASYLEFITPGIVVMTAFFGALWSGMTVVTDVRSGIIDRYLTTPASVAGIVLSRVVVVAVRVAAQAVIVVAVAMAAGARPDSGPLGFAVMLVASAILAVAFGALSTGLAIASRREETLIAVNQVLGLPLLFVSAIFIARNLMPGWMADVASLNPLQWAVDASRAALQAHPDWAIIWTCLSLLAVFAVICTAFSIRVLDGYRSKA
jgi:ABC-2 type transport system permease protein